MLFRVTKRTFLNTTANLSTNPDVTFIQGPTRREHHYSDNGLTLARLKLTSNKPIYLVDHVTLREMKRA